MHKDFFNPPNEYRIKPFWFLNGDLDDDELKRQVREMKEKGCGGVFICARQGLKVPYLSKKWFEKIKVVCDYADSIGFENWLYDEYPYPSGIGGGEVVVRHPESKAMVLVERVFDAAGGEDVWQELPMADVLYARAFPKHADGTYCFTTSIDIKEDIGNLQRQEIYQRTGLTAYNTKRYFTYEPAKYLSVTLPKNAHGWHIVVVMQRELGNFKYYGTYVDVCDRAAMKTFIETTHQKYAEHLGEGFKNVKGMFSDEVGLHGAIPWSKHVIPEMRRLYGYEADDFMPALYISSYPDAYRIRYRYYKAVHDLLVENYYKQVSDWCAENGIMLACECQSMRMSTQRYSHIVGGDTAHEKLGKDFRFIVEKNLYSYRANPKSVSSLTRQLNQTWSMIESFHSVGWSMTLQDAKWMFDRMAGFGINFYNVHAFYYTMESIVKHDAPPSQFYQNPYWKHYKLLGDYAARLSVFLTQTDSRANIAVLDPNASLWALLSNPFAGGQGAHRRSTDWEKEMHGKIKGTWGAVRSAFIYNGVDFDNLDAEIMLTGEIRGGKVCVGRAEYGVIVLPPLMCIESEAAKMLNEFARQGGKVFCVGMKPSVDIDGDFGIDADVIGVEDVIENIKPWLDGTVTVSYDEKYNETMLVTRRYDAEGALYVYISNQENNRVDVTLTVNGMDGHHFEQLSFEDGGSRVIDYDVVPLNPYELKVLKLVQGKADGFVAVLPQAVIDTDAVMDVSIDGENVLPFDTFEISVDKEKWATVDVSTVDNQLVAAGLAVDAGQMEVKGQGFGLPLSIRFTYPKTIYYKKEFYCDFVPENISVLMDESTVLQNYEMYINGYLINRDNFKKVFVNDIKNIKCPVSDFIVAGRNELFIAVTAENNWGGIRDNIYITGGFTVYKDAERGMVISEPTNRAKLTHTYIEGYPYYSGTFTFKTTLDAASSRQYAVELKNKGIYDCAEVLVNGVSLGVRAFAPYNWIGDLKEGGNKVKIKITNTLINMLEGGYFDYEGHAFVKV
jgi:hypothetical protein